MPNVQIEASWAKVLSAEFEKDYFLNLIKIIKDEKAEGKIIYPAGNNIFNAFSLTPINQVKVIILGQDPYHKPNQAHGLSFSVLPPTPPPPSLQNIYKELVSDVGITFPTHGDLSSWAQQGVLLLNSSLTVHANTPMSHSKIGWEIFTDAVISHLSNYKQHLVFVLWGKFAQSKTSLIDSNKHLIIQSAHPSPLSAYTGFFGSKPFSTTNNYLIQNQKSPINWQV
jgi:uracil-DNA glycosylase